MTVAHREVWRSFKNLGVCILEMVEQLYERFLAKRGTGNMIRRAWFRIASRNFKPDRDSTV